MTNKLDSSDRSDGDRAVSRAYHLEFWPGMAAYAVVLAGVLTWGNLDGDSPRRIDDYQRLLLLRGLGVPGVGWIIHGAGMPGWIATGTVVGRR
jgi:hypothetical protein